VIRVAAVVLLVVAAAGCRGPSPRNGLARAVDAARRERVERIGSALSADRVAWRLSPRNGLGAWAWPDGRVEVSRALVDRLDDEELAAALAHELGHLLDGGHLPGAGLARDAPLGLRGDRGADDIEARADRIGCTLLAHRGVACTAMARMLADVAAGLGGDAGMRRRADAVASACAAASAR
jgi:hypothetical protein